MIVKQRIGKDFFYGEGRSHIFVIKEDLWIGGVDMEYTMALYPHYYSACPPNLTGWWLTLSGSHL